jgi:metal-sulfur cluster biosynthetic enzyme
MVTKREVMKALEKCLDPELGLSVVEMGLIYEVSVTADKVHVKMTLTNPGCPMQMMISGDVEKTVKGLKGVKKAEVELVWEPRWTPDRLSSKAKKKLGYM